MAVYDLAGRRIRKLVDKVAEPGWHEVIWNGRDDAGRQVGSGVYFCRLESSGTAATRKLILLK